MARVLVMRVTALAPLAAMALQPQITPQPELYPRADASILGYISTSGASERMLIRSTLFELLRNAHKASLSFIASACIVVICEEMANSRPTYSDRLAKLRLSCHPHAKWIVRPVL